MPKFKPQHSRLLFIDKKIRDRTYPNCSSLAEEWEVSSKTIQRDIEYLRDMLDAPIAYSAKERGYFYTENSFSLPAFDLKDSDLFAICIADKLLQQYKNSPVYTRLQVVFSKIQQSLPGKVSFHSNNMDDKWWHQFPEPAVTMVQYQKSGQDSTEAPVVYPDRYKTGDPVFVK